jgi:hypothetical protein
MRLNRSIRSRALVGLAGALVALGLAAGAPAPAAAEGFLTDAGSYESDDGPICAWVSIARGERISECSGYSRALQKDVSYTCATTLHASFASWTCRDSDGYRWTGRSGRQPYDDSPWSSTKP